MLDKYCYNFFGLVCLINNGIVYLDLYVGFLDKIVYFLGNCLSIMKIDNCSTFRNTYN
jgi:hypothetical protein